MGKNRRLMTILWTMVELPIILKFYGAQNETYIED